MGGGTKGNTAWFGRHIYSIWDWLKETWDLKEQVKSILTNSVTVTLLTYSSSWQGNQDQIVILNMILEGIYPKWQGEPCCLWILSEYCKKTKILQMSYQTCHLPLRLLKLNLPKNDIVTVNLKTQDNQLDSKQNPMPKKVIETEAPKNDMVAVDLENSRYTTESKTKSQCLRRPWHQDTNLRESRRV